MASRGIALASFLSPVRPWGPPDRTWYSDVTRYQWLVLVIASAGWMFDAFEGHVFNITRGQMLADLMGSESSTEPIRMWGDTFLTIFLLGGTVGGVASPCSLGSSGGKTPAARPGI